MKPHIPYCKPSITALEVSFAANATKYGWGDRNSEWITQFETMFKAHIGSKHAIATSSCTGALTLGLAALGIGRGDEVILADTNWIASCAPIVHAGATPIFVDVDPVSWCIDWTAVEHNLYGRNRRVKAIVATHLYGSACNMYRLLTISERTGIPIIEDAAEAIGTQYFDLRAGSMGKFGVFSFHGSKTITTGEGGMFVCNDDDLYEKVLTLSNHGRSRKQTKQFWPDEIGFKFKISNVQAAIGCAQLQRIDELIARKRQIFEYYYEKLGHLAGVSMNVESEGTVNGYWMPTVVFDRKACITREMLFYSFREANIDARVFFHPLSSLPMFHPLTNLSNFKAAGRNRWAYDIPTRAINLPSFNDITEDEMDRVVDVIWGLLK